MVLENTFDEITEYDLLKSLALRPGMYTGRHRLDYIQCFLNGYYTSKVKQLNDHNHWHLDYHMQKWLFIKESVSIAHAASLNSWSLMKRCYGNKKEACDYFKTFVDETPYTYETYDIEDTVAKHIFQIYSYYHWSTVTNTVDFCSEVSKDYYPLSQEIKEVIGEVKHSYEFIFPFVDRMIEEPYDDLWIYLHYEKYYLQVRFLYHTKSTGWFDNTVHANCDNYYQNLVILHAYVALVQKKEHSNHIVTLHCKNNKIAIDAIEMDDVWNERDEDICNQNPLHCSFSAWRKKVVEPLE